MTTRVAACSCGQLTVTCTGEPIRSGVCHCTECQKRTGSVFAAQVRYPLDRAVIAGKATLWSRTGDSGTTGTFRFCPTCGSTVCWTSDGIPDVLYVATGAFADATMLKPMLQVYVDRKHPWVELAPDIERMD